jgi:hypothetical protein
MEDRPVFLDEPGEFWIANGIIYLVLPAGETAAGVTLELAARLSALRLQNAARVEIAGLAFRHFNIADPITDRLVNFRSMAAVHLDGPATQVTVRHCTFTQVAKAVLAYPRAVGDVIDHLTVRDCTINDTDQNAIMIRDGDQWEDPGRIGEIGHVNVLRNQLDNIGQRPWVHDEGHAIEIFCGQVVEVAGNMISRAYGSGIWCFNGKNENSYGTPSRRLRARPFNRVVVRENAVSDALLHTSDWGGIASWAGGPSYVYNNHVSNVRGYRHYSWRLYTHLGTPTLGLAVYFDHQYKGYAFNNVLRGSEPDPGARYSTTYGYFEANGFLNAVFNNTITGTVYGIGKYLGYNGHNRSHYLGNIFERMVATGAYINQNQGGDSAIDNPFTQPLGQGRVDPTTLAYGRNILAGTSTPAGGVGPNIKYTAVADFASAYVGEGALTATLGPSATPPVLTQTSTNDYRPESATLGQAVRYFVPWSLRDTVGEWHFRLSPLLPATIHGEHFNMSPEWYAADMYILIPRFNLTSPGLTATDYEAGVLEDWIQSAARLAPSRAYTLTHADMVADRSYAIGSVETYNYQGANRPRPDIGAGNLTVNFVARFPAGASGALAGKFSDRGWALALDTQGRLETRVALGTTVLVATDTAPLADDQWHHVIVEINRAQANGISLWVDGVRRVTQATGTMPAGDLANTADFILGARAGQSSVTGTLDFLRVARSTLAESETTAEELYTWEMHGPMRADFASRRATAGATRPAGALLGRTQPMDALHAWRAAHFGTAAPLGSADDEADPDGDTLPNLLEYALATDPLAANYPTPVQIARAPAEGNLQLTFTPQQLDVAFVLEASDDLVTWQSTLIATGSLVAGQAYTHTDTAPGDARRRFLRLRATIP